MSVRCISEVLDRSAHAGTELLMLVVLADYSDDQGNSYPAVASLAKKCRMTSRNANYILFALQASGELVVRKNKGPKGANRYRIVLSSLGLRPLKPTSGVKDASGMKPTSGVKSASATPEAGFPKPLKPTSDEPSLNRQEPSGRSRKQKAAASQPFVLPDWIPEEAWSGYVEMRQKKRAQMTDRARGLVVAELLKFKDAGYEVGAILDKSTANNWTDVYEPKGSAPAAQPAANLGKFL